MTALPLDGVLVLDFSQFLAGPSAALRLADFGARVIKIERPRSGEATRGMGLAGAELDGDSLLFHTINRNKESLAADLKDPGDHSVVVDLVKRADVLIQNFRPGVMERNGLGYEQVRELNPRLVYASVSGYGHEGPWRDKPGQDLVLQALTGLPWLNGRAADPPTPFGLSIVDQFAGAQLCQGILACLVRRAVGGSGGLVELSLLESALDLQFEGFTSFLNDSSAVPRRSSIGGAHPYISAPYGIYALADGYLAIAMVEVTRLGALLHAPELSSFDDPEEWFARRDEIKALVAEALAPRHIRDVLEVLEADDVWCAEVLTWPELVSHEGFQAADIVRDVGDGPRRFLATRCPIRIDGEILESGRGAPRLGEHQALPTEREAWS
jgi:crotonobetainyl-CoA:carnitine CoA-transferase CaiB-like acyl-CoA transferase